MAANQAFQTPIPNETPTTTAEMIEWDSPNEKRNPRNWLLAKKILHTAFPCLLAFWM